MCIGTGLPYTRLIFAQITCLCTSKNWHICEYNIMTMSSKPCYLSPPIVDSLRTVRIYSATGECIMFQCLAKSTKFHNISKCSLYPALVIISLCCATPIPRLRSVHYFCFQELVSATDIKST